MDAIFGFLFLAEILLWVVNGLSFLGGIGVQDYPNEHERKKMRFSWKSLAEINNLSFVSGKFSRQQKVFGQYKHHHLTLNGSGSGDGATTQLTLSTTPQSAKSIFLTNDGVLKTPPSVTDIEHLFDLDQLKHNIWGNISATPNGRVISYKQSGIETSPKYLQFLFDWLSDIADAYPAIVALGGEAVPQLYSFAEKYSRIRPLVTQLLSDIANEAKTRLGEGAEDLICPRCFTSYTKHEVNLTRWQSITYYGCRTCHQNRKFFQGWVIAALDNSTTQEQAQQNGVIWVNWTNRRTLFDFDEVQIVQATDEEVERFAVQVGNDTDPLRKPRYQQMRCVISPDCDLSENSLRILRRMFGSVEVSGIPVSLQ